MTQVFQQTLLSLVALNGILSLPTIPSTQSPCDYTLKQCQERFDDYQCYTYKEFAWPNSYPKACGDVCGITSSNSYTRKVECDKYCEGFVSQNISCDQTTTTVTTTTSTTTTPVATTIPVTTSNTHPGIMASSELAQHLPIETTQMPDCGGPNWKQLCIILSVTLGVVFFLFIVVLVLYIRQRGIGHKSEPRQGGDQQNDVEMNLFTSPKDGQ